LQLQQDTDEDRKRRQLGTLANITALFMALDSAPLGLDLNELTKNADAYACWSQYLDFIVDPQAAARAMGVRFPYDDGLNKKPPEVAAAEPKVEFPDFYGASDAGRDARVRWLFKHDTLTGILKLGGEGTPESAVTFRVIVEAIAESLREFYSKTLTPAESHELEVPQNDGETALHYLFRAMEGLFESLRTVNPDAKPPYGKERFDLQDFQVYPIIFGTDLGEFEAVDIFRISPEDTRPIAGTAPPGVNGSPVLRGQSYGAFGAFLDQEWRLSDMLRGRLDGAERLITAILPDADEDTLAVRECFIKKAQEAITREWKEFEKKLNLKISPEKKRLIRLTLDKLELPDAAGREKG
jgi:hypothetical protein